MSVGLIIWEIYRTWRVHSHIQSWSLFYKFHRFYGLQTYSQSLNFIKENQIQGNIQCIQSGYQSRGKFMTNIKFGKPVSRQWNVVGYWYIMYGFVLQFFSCDQATLWKAQSVCPSVCPPVRLSVTPFSLCSHHRIIMKFSGVITDDRSDVHAKGQGQRSKVKVTEVTTQLNRFRTVTPVWIHKWWWNDA